MTETQATAGSAGAPATPAEEEPPVDAAGPADAGGSAIGTASSADVPASDSAAAPTGTPPSGDPPHSGVPGESRSVPLGQKFTRPPGMPPPPDTLVGPGGVPAGSISAPAAADEAPKVTGSASVPATGVVRPPGAGSDGAKAPEPTVRTTAGGVGSVPVSGVPVSGPGALATPSGSQTVIAKAQVPAALTTPSGAHQNLAGAATIATAPPPVIARASVGAATAAAAGTATRPAMPGSAAVGAARVSEAVRTARATVAGAASRGPRRARLHLKRIDPWSVMKFSFAVSLVLFVVVIVATSVLYLALDAMGVFDSINQALADMVGQANGSSESFKITAKGVIGSSVLLGAVNMVLFTALMTLAAFVYNVCADLVGGVELTLSEKD